MSETQCWSEPVSLRLRVGLRASEACQRYPVGFSTFERGSTGKSSSGNTVASIPGTRGMPRYQCTRVPAVCHGTQVPGYGSTRVQQQCSTVRNQLPETAFLEQ
eukprot:88861-Rhodomonas_salina.1